MRPLLIALFSLCLTHAAWAEMPVKATHAQVSFLSGQTTGAGYVTLKNASAAPITISNISSDCCASVEMHEMQMDGDIMRMRSLPKLEIAAGKEAIFGPDENHIMFIGLKKPAVAGDAILTQFHLSDGQSLPVKFAVQTKGRP